LVPLKKTTLFFENVKEHKVFFVMSMFRGKVMCKGIVYSLYSIQIIMSMESHENTNTWHNVTPG